MNKITKAIGFLIGLMAFSVTTSRIIETAMTPLAMLAGLITGVIAIIFAVALMLTVTK